MGLEQKSLPSPLNKLKWRYTDDADLVLDSEIDKLLEDKALKSNLSVFNVKSIIRQVIKNQMVQEVVWMKMMRAENETANDDQRDSNVAGVLNEGVTFSFEPKLTRAKIKELISKKDQLRLPLWPISPAKLLPVLSPPTETQILITSQDLPEESEAEDDEYIPKETDFQPSDDDASVTSVSDFGSPAAPFIRHSMGNKKKREVLGAPNRFNSGDPIFKTPSPKKQNPTRTNAIGLRTRSKLPLNDTPLEVLEKQLIPPDITIDMYEWNESDNEDYLQFLKTFAFSTAPEGGNDDEEADPEYNVMEDEEDDHDKEEHRVDRAVKVSKKELNELIAELFDNYQISDNNEENGDVFTSVSTQSTASISQSKLPKSQLTPALTQKMFGINSSEKTLNTLFPEKRCSELPIDDNITLESMSRSQCLLQDCSTQTVPLPERGCDRETTFVNNPKVEPSFSADMIATLRHQIQKHIQLLATTYSISVASGDSQVAKAGYSAKALLLEISRLSELRGGKSICSGKNLAAAIEVVYTWPSRISQPNTNSPIKKKILEDYRSRSNLPEYEKRVIRLIAESTAFMYPNLLPSSVSVCCTRATSVFTNSEDNLIIRGMDDVKTEHLRLREISTRLSATLLPVRTPRQIYDRIKNVRKSLNKLKNSSLQAYFEKNILPAAKADFYTPDEALAPIQQPREYLSQKWRRNIEMIAKPNYLNSVFVEKKSVSFGKRNREKSKISREERATNQKEHVDATEEKPSCDPLIASGVSSSSVSASTSSIQTSSDYQVYEITNQSGEIQFCYSVPTIVIGKPNTEVCAEDDSFLDQHNRTCPTNDVMEGVEKETHSDKSGTKSNTGSWGDTTSDVPSSQVPTSNKTTSQKADKNDSDEGEDDEQSRRYTEKFYNDPVSDEQSEELAQTTDEENMDMTDEIKETVNAQDASICTVPGQVKIPHMIMDNSTTLSSERPPISSGGDLTGGTDGNVNRAGTSSTPPTLKCVNVENENDDVIETFSEAFLVNVRQSLEKRNPPLYMEFIQLFHSCATTDMTDHELYVKMEQLLKDYPDLVNQFQGLQTAELAFTTGNFAPYESSQAQVELLQLLQKWSVYCPLLKILILQQLRSLHDADTVIQHAADLLQPILSQIKIPLILDSFKIFFGLPTVPDHIEQGQVETSDEESDPTKEKDDSDKNFLSSPDPTAHENNMMEITSAASKRRRKITPPTSASSSCTAHIKYDKGNKRKKDKTTPVAQLLKTSEQEEDVLEAFSEAFLISVRQRLETRNPSLYASFLHLFNDCLVNDMPDEELYSKTEELLKDYPNLVDEFRGLQTAEAAFTTGSFVQYQESHTQIQFLQLLEKWTINCPQLKTKIIQKLKSLQETPLTETKVVDVMQPLFSQIPNPLILDTFKALFPIVFRPQSCVSDIDYEEMDLEGDDKHDCNTTSELEFDTYESVKLPEEKHVVATNSCPCSCHEDPENVHYHTRARHCNKCCLRFQDGRLFLHSGRVMKPVSIEFTSPELAKQVFASSTYATSKATSTRPTFSSQATSCAVLPKKQIIPPQ